MNIHRAGKPLQLTCTSRTSWACIVPDPWLTVQACRGVAGVLRSVTA